MRALDDLRQLAGVADQHDVARGPAHGDHIGKTNLSRLVHEQPVEGLHILVAGEEPGSRADHMLAACRIVIAGGPANGAIVGITVILAAGLVDQIECDRQIVHLPARSNSPSARCGSPRDCSM